jgi:hypothetical protein
MTSLAWTTAAPVNNTFDLALSGQYLPSVTESGYSDTLTGATTAVAMATLIAGFAPAATPVAPFRHGR